MKQEESRTELGLIRIHKKAISAVASIAACEIEGVKRLGDDIRRFLFDAIGKNKGAGSIKVEIDANGEVKIDIPLIVKYGYNIPEVASQVQDNVRRNLEKTTSLIIKDININVQGIERG